MKVLVTGASRGIGYEISKELLESNHNVVMHCNQNKKALEGLQKKHANKSHIVTADLSNLKEIKELINSTIKKFDFAFSSLNYDPQIIEFEGSSVTRLPQQYHGKRLGHLWSISWVAENIEMSR